MWGKVGFQISFFFTKIQNKTFHQLENLLFNKSKYFRVYINAIMCYI